MYASMILGPFYFLFQNVLVPYTQLLNESRIKKLILRSGWPIALRSVLKYNQNAVDPLPLENFEMGSLNRNGTGRKPQNDLEMGPAVENNVSNMNPRTEISQSPNESSYEVTSNRRGVNISWPKKYCSRTRPLSAVINRNRHLAYPFAKINFASSSRANDMHTIEEENETDAAEELVETNEQPSTNTDLHTGNSSRCGSLADESECKLEPSVGNKLFAKAPSPKNPISTEVCLPKEFKTFCRTELVNKLIVVQYSSEIKYLQIFQHLLTLENELYKTGTCLLYTSDAADE